MSQEIKELNGLSFERQLWDKLTYWDIQQVSDYLKDCVDDSFNSLDMFPDPYTMKDMDKAVELLANAIISNKRILCVADSDADGMGTYVIFNKFFKLIGYNNVKVIIAKRADGYGFTPKHIINEKQKPDLIITADNGITAHEACKLAKNMNITTIITDHHQVSKTYGLPEADAVVNPHRPDCTFKYPYINGTFVLWFVVKALAERLNVNADIFHMFLPELTLTTISDVMPLKHINRFVVKYGLANFPQLAHNTPWLRCFLGDLLNNIKRHVDPSDMGFNIIPKINATGRLTDPQESADFLNSENDLIARTTFAQITFVNDDRKTKQEGLQKIIMTQYGRWFNFPFILIPGKGDVFNKGILGPVSGRIAEQFSKPTVVMTLSPCGKYFSGSGRSTGDVDLLGIVSTSKYLITKKSGGHKAACGVTIKREDLWRFFFDIQMATLKLDPMLFRPKLTPICLVDIGRIPELFDECEKFQPFGHQFEKPLFGAELKVKKCNTIGKLKNHLTGVVTDGVSEIRFLWFSFATKLSRGEVRKLVFEISLDEFNMQDSENPEYVLHIKKVVSNI